MKAEEVGKYGLTTCIQCGMCTGSCPLTIKSRLNMRRLVGHLIFNGGMLDEADLWDCTTCHTCSYRCPRGVKLLDLMVKLRSSLIEEGKIPRTVAEALENTFKYGNPWGRSRAKRSEWAQELGVKSIFEKKQADVLLFTCCASAYDTRARLATKSLTRVLKSSGVDLAILGEEEVCCGNEVYNLGELGLFEELMTSNLEALNRCEVSLIVTTSPHCFHALRNRYRGLRLEVKHYTQYLCELLDKGGLRLQRKVEGLVTYHDPCYLGRHNGIYEEPRKLLEAVLSKGLVEMDRSRSRSVCCEGGGGRMWYEGTPGRRLGEVRVDEAIRAGASVIAVACPFCLANLEDAVKTMDLEESLKVADISELLLNGLLPTAQ